MEWQKSPVNERDVYKYIRSAVKCLCHDSFIMTTTCLICMHNKLYVCVLCLPSGNNFERSNQIFALHFLKINETSGQLYSYWEEMNIYCCSMFATSSTTSASESKRQQIYNQHSHTHTPSPSSNYFITTLFKENHIKHIRLKLINANFERNCHSA